MVPTSAILVIGDDNGGVFPEAAVLDGLDDVGDVLLAAQKIGVTGMLIIRTQRLDKGYRRQLIAQQIAEERRLVL